MLYMSLERAYLKLSRTRRSLIYQLFTTESRAEFSRILGKIFAISKKLHKLKNKVNGNVEPIIW